MAAAPYGRFEPGDDYRPIANTEAEQALLGAIMIHNSLCDDVAEIIQDPRDFFMPVHGRIYARYAGAQEAKDIMHPARSVRLGQTVEDAFHLLRAAGLDGLPITDDQNRVVAYADQWDLAAARATLA